jgi:hypothetical protein
MKDSYNPFQKTGINFFSHCGEFVQIVYAGSYLSRVDDGGLVFFQRHDGLFWMGRTWPDLFWLELEVPVKVMDGLSFLAHQYQMQTIHEADGDFVHQHELPF